MLNCFCLSYHNETMSPDCICLESALSHAASPSLSEFGPERSPLVVQLQSHSPTPTPPAILQDLQQPDSTSYVLLTLAKGIIKCYLVWVCMCVCLWWIIQVTLISLAYHWGFLVLLQTCKLLRYFHKKVRPGAQASLPGDFYRWTIV